MIPYLGCMALAAALSGLPPRALPAIQMVEGGAVGTIAHNRDGSDDFGVMQINSRWLGPLATAFHLSEPDVKARLVDNACFNILAASLILKVYLRETRGEIWQAIGYYHSHHPLASAKYQLAVGTAAAHLATSGSRGER